MSVQAYKIILIRMSKIVMLTAMKTIPLSQKVNLESCFRIREREKKIRAVLIQM